MIIVKSIKRLIYLLLVIGFIFTYVSNKILKNNLSQKEIRVKRELVAKPIINCKIRFDNVSQVYYDINGVVYPKVIPLSRDSTINFDCLNKQKPKLILFWTEWLSNKPFNLKAVRCPAKSCIGTSDKSLVNKSDIILFHMRHFSENDMLPRRHSYNQSWMFFLIESPLREKISNKFNGVFNLSATYKKTSNITSPYYREFIWKENKKYDVNKDRLIGKKKIAAIIMSNCIPKSKRLDYVKEMQKHMPVEIYGKCGEPCPVTSKEKNCREVVAKNFMFYLSFENALCDDYISEKFFEILPYDIVPVVLGGGNYATYVPKEGYINVLDYGSPKAVAEYLMYLSKNSTAYNSYFKWKRYVTFMQQSHFLCEVCILTHLMEKTNHVIENMDDFWHAKKDCKRNDEFLKMLFYLTSKNF